MQTVQTRKGTHDPYLDEILSLQDAAKERKVSVETLRAEIKRGTLRAIRLSQRRIGMLRREALRGL